MTWPPLIISDAELAALLASSPRPSGKRDIATPSFTGHQSGPVVTLRSTGNPPPPDLADYLPGGELPPPVALPSLADFEADFTAAARSPVLAPLTITTAETFRTRLAACRSCVWWHEPARCDHPESTCARRLPYLAACQCPASKWPLQ